MSMEQAALVLLKDNGMAQCLAVAWPRAHAAWKAHKRESLESVWAEHAGLVSPPRAVMSMLRLNEICSDDGVTDALALAYIRGVVAKSLPKPAARRKGE